MALFVVALGHRSELFRTGSTSTLSPLMLKIVKNFSYSCSSHKFPYSVNRKGLLLLLLGGDVSLNPGPLALSVLNARSIRNKGPLLADIVTSNDTDILCLTDTHICPYD